MWPLRTKEAAASRQEEGELQVSSRCGPCSFGQIAERAGQRGRLARKRADDMLTSLNAGGKIVTKGRSRRAGAADC